MKLRDGIAENLTIPRLFVADIGQGLNGLAEIMDCLQNGSTPAGENCARIATLLSSASLVLSEVNRELLSIVADGDVLEDAMSDDGTPPYSFYLSPGVAATIYRILVEADLDCDDSEMPEGVTKDDFRRASQILESQGVMQYTPELDIEGGAK